MGKQTNLVYRGTQGNLIYYERQGGYYIRTKPVQVNQTIATKASAGKFGKAVSASKNIRAALAPLLPDTKDRPMMNRLNAAIYKWLLEESLAVPAIDQPVTALTGFQFNEKTTLAERLKLTLATDWQQTGQVVLSIPAMNPLKKIAAPAHTLLVELQLMVVTCNMADQMIMATQTTTITIPYIAGNIPAQQIHLPVEIKAGYLAIIAGALKYNVQSKQGIMIDDKMQWKPAEIIDAVYSH